MRRAQPGDSGEDREFEVMWVEGYDRWLFIDASTSICCLFARLFNTHSNNRSAH